MNKEQFISSIRDSIADLPQNDINKSLDYYGEMIDDYIDDGLTEEQAVEAMGTVEEIVSQILMDTPLQKLVKAKVSPARSLKIWEIILLIVGSPIWISLLLAVFAVCLSLYIVIWSVVIVLYAINFSFAASGLACIVGSALLVFTGNHIQAVLFLGIGLFFIGAAILLFFTFNKVTSGVVKFSKFIVVKIKSLFIRKGDAK